MTPSPSRPLHAELFAGLKQGVLIAAAGLVLTLPPPGLATSKAVVTAEAAPAARSGPFRHADFAGHRASDDARFIADWAADSGDSRGLPYVILDKRDARVFVFQADGKLIDSSPVLLGATPGDDSAEGIGDKAMSQVRQDEKTTPAGRFTGTPGKNTSHEDVFWVDYDNAVSMHRVRLVDPKERRLERLASDNPADRRISYGCINVPVAFFESVIWPTVKPARAIVYVLPETRDVRTVFAAAYDAADRGARRGTMRTASAQSRVNISPR